MNYTRLPRRGVLLLDRGGDRNLLLALGVIYFLLGDVLLLPPGDGDRLLPLLGDLLRRHLGDRDGLLRTRDLPLLEGCGDTDPFSPLDRSRPRLLPLDDRPFPRLSPISWRVPLLLPPGALVSVTLGLVPVRTDGL